MYNYKFSVVMPVYNVEEYLEESIVSVLNQTIGFEKNIQLILVNDGSKDESEKICLKYKERYPKNVIYVKQENSGVSTARNNGMNFVEGKYVNFLDSDDKWDKDAFEKVWDFFEKHSEQIDLLSCRMKFFEGREDYHVLDYKFGKNRIVDIFGDYDFIQLHINSSFLKSEMLEKFKFDTKLKYAEDAKFVNLIILEKQKYGLIRDTRLHYRKRKNNSSAIQNKSKAIEWYTDTIEYYCKELINVSKAKFNRVIPYIQFLLMYDIQWRLKEDISEVLNDKQKEEYFNEIVYLLKNFEDYIICEQKKLYSEYKIYALTLKYGYDIKKDLKYKRNVLYFNNIPIYTLKSKALIKVNILEIKGNRLILEGEINCPLLGDFCKIYLYKNNNERYELQTFDIYNNTRIALGEVLLNNKGYKIEIPIKKSDKLSFVIEYKGDYKSKANIVFGKFAKITSTIKNSYYSKGKFLLRYTNNNIIVKRKTKKEKLKYEIRLLKELKSYKKYSIILYRILYYVMKKINKKEIWLISDRENFARDNGEAFFEYVMSLKDKNKLVYFVLSPKCKDYRRIKKIGKVIKSGTIKHKLYFLLASKVISSQANEKDLNIFMDQINTVKDLYKFDFIFLQHGIIKDDLSDWLFKYKKNIKMFVTSATGEYESIINGKYNYDKSIVKLTGLPRYDKLYSTPSKNILILPTQRRALVEWDKEQKSKNSYNPYFKESECYKFYNNLINDERLIKCLKKNGYKMKLCLHPLHQNQCIDFEENEFCTINKQEVDYPQEFANNSLLITDYSSVAFDFAYLKKPVVYTQFDREEFYEGQVYEVGYFDYDIDGLGPVCYDYETTINTIIEIIENDCKVEKKYLERIEKFYRYFDKNNCKRVYDEIIKLDK